MEVIVGEAGLLELALSSGLERSYLPKDQIGRLMRT